MLIIRSMLLLESINNDFNEKTIRAFRALAIEEKPADQVAEELGMTSNACLIARSRVLKKLRERLREMFGDDEGFFELNW